MALINKSISVLKNVVAGHPPRRAAFWKAQHIVSYVSICKTSRNAGSRPDAPEMKNGASGCQPRRTVSWKAQSA